MGLFSRKKRAIDYFEAAYKNAFKLLYSSNYRGSPVINDDLIPLLFVVTDVANLHSGKDRYEFGDDFARWIDKMGRRNILDQRIDFYGQFLRGKRAKMEFWLGDPIEERDPITELAGAFCDILNSPELQNDYDDNVLHLGSVFDAFAMVQQVFVPLNELLGKLYIDIRNS